MLAKLKAWLYPLIKNEWMNNANVLAQIAHVGWMFAIVSNAGWLFGNHVCLDVAVVFASYAVIKEWLYDANFEIPKQSWKDNLLDMSTLWLGIILGLGIVFWLKPLVGK